MIRSPRDGLEAGIKKMQIEFTALLSLAGCALLTVPLLARSGTRTEPTPATDQQFIKMAAESDMLHAHLGQMAEKQSARRGIRDLGLEIRKNDTADYQVLSDLSAKTGTTIPKGIDERGDKTINRLSRLKGVSFDHAFITEVIDSDKKTVATFEQKAKDAQNPEVKTYAANALPALKLHLNEAEDWVKYGDDRK